MTTKAAERTPKTAFEPGRNCWRVEHAERFRCIQDGAEYFRIVREAILKARRSIFILGWDIAAGVDLLPGSAPQPEPTELAKLLDFVARRQRSLHCYILIWDYAALYALERDPFSRIKLGWQTHRRVHFRFDDQHPLGACHHQKVIVVDDRIAFSGGIDLTGHRWDTTEHRVDHPLRKTVIGKPYTPYHEVQAMAEGPIAASLGELSRERWLRAGGTRVAPLAPATQSYWPEHAEPDLREVEVAIARTEPRFGRRAPVFECKELFFDSIKQARESIYIENQYFTNDEVGKALGRRLHEKSGPEIIVIGPKECQGWLERKTIGELRVKVLAALQKEDRHGRLRLLYPVASRKKDVCTFIHSKVMIVDDRILRIGSANLSHRSMGMDTECDLAVEAAEKTQREGIRCIRDRLLAEHLGVSRSQVRRAVEKAGSLRDAIDRLGGGDRTLMPYEIDTADANKEDSAILAAADPEAPSAVSQALDRMLPEIELKDRRSRHIVWLLPATLFLILFLITTYEAGGWLSLASLREFLAEFPAGAFSAFLGFLGFLFAGLLFVPLELLLFVSTLFYGIALGGVLAIAGAIGSATLGYFLGRSLGLARLSPILGTRIYRLWRELRGQKVATVAMLRVVSIASASTIHLLCGAARIPPRKYALGSLIGLLPSILVFCALGALFREAIGKPESGSWLVTIVAALVMGAIALRVRRSLLIRYVRPAMRDQEEWAQFG